jgi:hypothetical protein
VFALVIFEENNSNYENHHNYNTNPKKRMFYKENLEVGALYLPKIPQICESVTTFVVTTAVFVTFTESKLTIKCQCLRKIKKYWVFLHTVHKYIIGQKAGKE